MTKPKESAIDKVALTSARWDFWRQTWRILHDESLSPREKLSQCDQVAATHAAMYCDLEIYPPNHPLRKQREQLIQKIPAAIARASKTQKNKKHGQVEITL